MDFLIEIINVDGRAAVYMKTSDNRPCTAAELLDLSYTLYKLAQDTLDRAGKLERGEAATSEHDISPEEFQVVKATAPFARKNKDKIVN